MDKPVALPNQESVDCNISRIESTDQGGMAWIADLNALALNNAAFSSKALWSLSLKMPSHLSLTHGYVLK